MLLTCGSLASAQKSPAVAPENMPEAEFQSLVEKTNLYVRALNAVSGKGVEKWVDPHRAGKPVCRPLA